MKDKVKYEVINLFGEKEIRFVERDNSKVGLFHDYEGFVDKFTVNKTTDDCYTPEGVYNIVLDYVRRQFDIKNKTIVRPFFPGMNYKKIEYNDNDIVIDNPPFSILTDICRWYDSKGIKFFLFAPHLTLFSINVDSCSYIICNASIEYENKAKVATSFVTNIPEEAFIKTAYKLSLDIKSFQDGEKTTLPKYTYPDNLITVSLLGKIVTRGEDFTVKRSDAFRVTKLDSQDNSGKSIFGSGFLVSDNKAEEVAYKSNLPLNRIGDAQGNIEWKLSERELEIIRDLDK